MSLLKGILLSVFIFTLVGCSNAQSNPNSLEEGTDKDQKQEEQGTSEQGKTEDTSSPSKDKEGEAKEESSTKKSEQSSKSESNSESSKEKDSNGSDSSSSEKTDKTEQSSKSSSTDAKNPSNKDGGADGSSASQFKEDKIEVSSPETYTLKEVDGQALKVLEGIHAVEIKLKNIPDATKKSTVVLRTKEGDLSLKYADDRKSFRQIQIQDISMESLKNAKVLVGKS